ncbi:unnamed protein product, partial [marine sediment metagenome]
MVKIEITRNLQKQLKRLRKKLGFDRYSSTIQWLIRNSTGVAVSKNDEHSLIEKNDLEKKQKSTDMVVSKNNNIISKQKTCNLLEEKTLVLADIHNRVDEINQESKAGHEGKKEIDPSFK